MRVTLKNIVVVVVLAAVFIASTWISALVSVNISFEIQNSNRSLDEWIRQLQSQGYQVHYGNFNPSGTLIKVDNIDDFELLLIEHGIGEAYWHWTQHTFTLQIIRGKIWFTDGSTTYYLEIPW